MKTGLKYFVPVTLIAMALAWACEQIAALLGIELPQQDLVLFFTSPKVPMARKLVIGAIALFVCPPIEELIFRKFLHRWVLRRWMGFWMAAAISGVVFAAVHLNLATFIPLLFLGVAFAWLYEKDGRLMASITCHFLFNLTNLIFCFIALLLETA